VTDSTDDFAALFEASLKAKRVEQGQTVGGTIVAIRPEVAFVDVGGKGEATIDVDELKDADGNLEVAVGDRIEAVVISISGGLTLSRRLARGAATARQLEDAFHSGLPVEGRIEKAVKGGYEVRIGGLRGFCPFSQIDIARGTDSSAHEGKVYTFRITEYKERGRNIVVSRRALLEKEQRAKADAVRRSLVAGAVLVGRVASVRDFGAFIDLGGGVQGLLHVSEMAWARTVNPSDLLQPGQEIAVKVLHVDEAKEKISLGMKQLAEDPWSKVPITYQVGQVVTGRVTRLAEFGVFVELEPGVEALAHASTFAPARGRQDWKSDIRPGMAADVTIVTIEVEKRRIGVALIPEDAQDAVEYREHVQRDTQADSFGSLGDKLRGALKPRQE
jgi:small subunit ribosomal protein S1